MSEDGAPSVGDQVYAGLGVTLPKAGELPKGTSVLSELEMLRARSLHQSILIETLQSQIAMQQVQKHETKKAKLMAELQGMKDALAAKHHINLNTHVIVEETGEVVPRGSVPDITSMMSHLTGVAMGQRKG